MLRFILIGSLSGNREVKIEGSPTANFCAKINVTIVILYNRVNDDQKDGTIAIIEIKASNWDRMTEKAVRRNVRRQIKQVWDYIESQIMKGQHVPTGEGKDVCPGIIFPKRPKDKERKKWIENRFEDEGIVVVWDDEQIQR